ncbi:MAG: hypothetical protein QM831_07995 [Kofleriaceae bacterium]
MRALLLLAVVACGNGMHVDVDKVSEAEARTFVDGFLKVAHSPCTVEAVEPMLDTAALGSRLIDLPSSVKGPARELAFKATQRQHSFAQMVCGWIGASADAKLKLITFVDGAPIVRGLWKPKDTTVVTYWKLFLGKRKSDGKVLLDDIYSYADGFNVAQNLNDFMIAGDEAGVVKAQDFVSEIQKAKGELDRGDARGALDTLDAMGPELKKVRAVQMMRIGAAQAIGQDVYARELHDLMAKYPNDPSVALLQIDDSVLQKDFPAALKAIDALDQSVGGDPYQDAIRSSIYMQMGDAAKALATAKNAVKAEPAIARTQLALLDAYALAGDFAAVRAQLDVLAKMGDLLSASALSTIPLYEKFAQSPQFADWQQLHP